MEIVTVEKENTVLIESDQIDTVVSEKTSTIVVTEGSSTTVATEATGVVVHEELLKQNVVQGGVQGPPGVPGASTQFEYAVAAQTLGGNRVVTTNSSGQLIYPDLTSENARVYGITTQSAATGELVQVQITGTQTEPSWGWNTATPVFVGPLGTLTQTPPTAGQILVVGYPHSPTKIFIDRQPPVYAG